MSDFSMKVNFVKINVIIPYQFIKTYVRIRT